MPARKLCWGRALAEGSRLDALLFGLRVAASAMLALFVAFSLQLDDPGWAATSAVIVAQPVLGATLRKGTLRLFGTVVGACAGVLLFALFPQDRIGFLLGLAAWGAACSFAATLLGEVLAYAPLLAGYTCAIVAMSAVAQPPDVFLLAVARGACIAIGIVATSLVFSLTEIGRQRGRLAGAIDAAAAEAVAGLQAALSGPVPDLAAGQAARRPLLARVAALDGIVDQAIGENLDLRARTGVLRRAIAGLLVILSSWRGVEQHRVRATATQAASDAAARTLQAALGPAALSPALLRIEAAQIEHDPAASASDRLLLDRAAHGLDGLAAVQAGLALLRTPLRADPQPGLRPTRLRNPASAALNGLRSFVTVALAGGAWVATGWESGPTFVIFAMVVVVLFGNRDDMAFSGSVAMAASCAIALVLAALIRFAAMPWAQGQGFDDFASLCVLLGAPLVVLSVIARRLPPGQPAAGLAFMTLANFMPLFSPTNQITYDFSGFINGGLAILGGATLGASAHRLLPPLPRTMRARLLLQAARRDLRRIATGAWRPEQDAWEARQYARLVSLPAGATLLDHAKLLAALSVGRELLRAKSAEAHGAWRAEASRVEIAEAMSSHPEFFDGLGLGAVAGR